MPDSEAREENNKREDAGDGSVALPAPVEAVLAKLPDAERSDRFGQAVVVMSPGSWPEAARRLRDVGFESLVDLCGVDYSGYPSGSARGTRFEVVVNLVSYSLNSRLRVRVPADGNPPRCPSVCDVWPGANWHEREAYDMFGIEFTGHPELARILMPDDWPGHPLRKDFATGSIPVQFSGSPRPQ